MKNTHIKLVSAVYAARRVGVPLKDLKQAAREGTIPCTKVGSRFVFDIDALEKTLLQRASIKEFVPKKEK